MRFQPFSRLLAPTLLFAGFLGAHLGRPTQALTADEPQLVVPYSQTFSPAALAREQSVVQNGPSDPSQPGPFPVSTFEYDLGDSFFNQNNPLPGLPPDDPATTVEFENQCEFRGYVTYPANLGAGPFPVVVFMHGQHATVHDGTSAAQFWPPQQEAIAVPNHRGYDYVMRHLSSRGFICVSISANGVNASMPGAGPTGDFGNTARASLLDAHIALIEKANSQSVNGFNNQFIGKLKLDKVALVGHSRGGEAIVQWFVNRGFVRPNVRIAGLVPVCPTNFEKFTPYAAPLGVILGYADGDVWDLKGIQYYDRTRWGLNGVDLAPKHVFTVQGANHNFFNTVWSPGGGIPGYADDWYQDTGRAGYPEMANRVNDKDLGRHQGTQKLDEFRQQLVLKSYLTGFLETYLEGDTRWELLLNNGGYLTGLGPNAVSVSYQPGTNPTGRLDVNRLLGPTTLTTNILGGKVTAESFAQYALAGGNTQRPHIWGYQNPNGPTPWEPHTAVSSYAPGNDLLLGTSVMVGSWKGGATWTNELPAAYRNVTRFQALQFRACVDWKNLNNREGVPLDMEVGLRDVKGVMTTQHVGRWTNALQYPHGTRDNDIVPKFVMATVRIPIWSLVGPDLTNIKEVVFDFRSPDRGSIVIGEVELVDGTTPYAGKLAINKKIDFSPKKKKKRKTVPIGTTKSMPLVIGNSSETNPMALRFVMPEKGPFQLYIGTQRITDSSGIIAPGQVVTFDVRFTPTTSELEKGGILVLTSAHEPVLVKLQGQGK